MDYVVYCDESRHDGLHSHRFMAIGGLWVQKDQKAALSRHLRDLMKSVGLNSEMKWNKVSMKRLSAYKLVIDFFFESQFAHYRAIVVDQSTVDLKKYHDGDPELGFYKFYYQMLKAWIGRGNRYRLLLDFKQNRGARRYKDLRKILHRRANRAGAVIQDLTVIDSAETPLAQICDVLTGAVAASCCSDIQSAKAELAAYIAKRVGIHNLAERSYSPTFSKFNIFRINLS